MKQGLGFFLFLSFSTAVFAASDTLILRGTILPTFSIHLSSGIPTLISNVRDDGGPRPQLKVEQEGNNLRVTIIHP